MAQKYTLASSGTSYSRLCADPIHLSDGTLVFLYHATSASDLPVLAYTTDRATINTIGTVTGMGTRGQSSNRDYAICRDASDNIFVIGYGTQAYNLEIQAFTKGAGHTWTQQAACGPSSGGTGFMGKTAVWCNTGGGTGGAGHLLVVCGQGNNTNVATYAFDAGAALAGTMTQTSGAENVGGVLVKGSTYGPQLSADGFGATSGLVVVKDTGASTVRVTAWSISSSGAVTGTALTAITAGSSTFTWPCAIRYAANAWAVICDSATAGQYLAARYSSTAQLTAATASGTPTGMAMVGNTLEWGAFLDPTTANRVWVLGIDITSSGTAKRVSVDVGSGVTWATAATTDDTLSPIVTGTGRTCEAHIVAQPVGSPVDWQFDIQTATTPTYAAVGDYTTFIPPISDSVGVLIG